MVIYKFPLEITEKQFVPVGSEEAYVLSVGEQIGELVMWVALDETSEDKGWKILVYIHGTGKPCNMSGSFVGTVQMPDGLVWHVFVERMWQE